jgi:hypothetical protein
MPRPSSPSRARRLALNEAARLVEELGGDVDDALYRTSGETPWRRGAQWMAERIARRLRDAAKHARRGP